MYNINNEIINKPNENKTVDMGNLTPKGIIEFSQLSDEQKKLVIQLESRTEGIASGRGTLWAEDIKSLSMAHRVALGSSNTSTLTPVLLHSEKKGYCVIAPQHIPKFGIVMTGGKIKTGVNLSSIEDF